MQLFLKKEDSKMKDKNTVSSKRWGWLAIGLCAAMMLPWQAGAKPTPPLTMTAAFDNANPEINRSETLRVTLSTTKSYANLAVAVSLPKEITFVSGKPKWKGALNAGEKRVIVMKVMLRTTGRYTINVKATFDPAESPVFSASTISLNVIAESSGVISSMKDFSTMDWQRAKTATDKKSILGKEGTLIKTPAVPGVLGEVPPFLKPADQKEKPAAPQKPESSVQGTISVVVSGYMKYKDSAGTSHPIRYARVQVVDNDLIGEEVMGEGATDGNGAYSITASGGDIGSGPDIIVRVHCAIMNNAVASVGLDSSVGNIYYMNSPEYDDHEGSTLTVSMTTGKPVINSTTDDDNARRFSILDGALQVAINAYALRGNNLMAYIPVVCPADTAYYKYDNPVYIGLLRKDALDWDVIGHEYGHYLADKGSSSVIDTSPGGAHDGSSAIPTLGKDAGVRLAWSEGWATFYSIIAQIEPSQTLLSLPNIPNVGDRIYHDTEDGTATDDLETFTNTGLTGAGQGYACEYSISGVLYDLCDADVDTSCDGLSKDIVDITPKQLWNVMNSGAWDDVGKFYNALCTIVGYDVATILYFSPIFALNNVGPELSTPAEGTVVSSVVSPEFKWTANGDPTAGYAHNHFDLVIAKNNFTELVGIKEDIQDIKYTFTETEWAAITAQSDGTGEFQWAVTGYNSINPRLPTAAGLGKFVSNTQTFKLRAYHIRLTWPTVGADVDLHLKPPSGTDCYYANRNPDWGVAGDLTDDPSLDRDCITSCAEENLTVDKVTTPGNYRVWVHYFSDHDMGATTATIQIFQYGQLISTASHVLSETGDSWNVFDFSIGASANSDIIVECPREIIRGVTGLPPKQPEE